MKYYKDNIIALATAEQNAAIGIVRVSGKNAKEILETVFEKKGAKISNPKPWHMHYGKIVDRQGEELDHCLAVYMPGPNSYTGEDIVEFHCHGNLILLKNIIKELLLLSPKIEMRSAEPGEFTKRAYLNGKLDLTQAESVHELIMASSEAALKSSLHNLDGNLHQILNKIREELVSVLSDIEASFEFPEEDIQTYDKENVFALLISVCTRLESIAQAYNTSKLFDSGVSVVIVGCPNVGKSSLLNAILIEDRAIVTDVPGTTRDVIEGAKIINGVRFIFRDTAGLRESGDQIEQTGILKTSEWMERSDIILWIEDEFLGEKEAEKGLVSSKYNNKIIKILNKADVLTFEGKNLSNLDAKLRDKLKDKNRYQAIVSVKTGFGLEEVNGLLKAWLEQNSDLNQKIHVNERQKQKIDESISIIHKTQGLMKADCEEDIVAANLRIVVSALEEIVGFISSEDVLSEIFGKFCIGK